MKQNLKLDAELSRRFFLAQSGHLVAFAGMGALAGALGIPSQAHAQEWQKLRKSSPKGGYGKVKELAGVATAEGRKLKVGSRVESGEQIRVAAKSHLILSLSDHTILRFNASTIASLEIGQRRTGFFRLLVGSLLTVMPVGNRYLIHMPTATVGIKGTIFFNQIYAPGERTAWDKFDEEVFIPEWINEYFCLCNGLADFIGVKAAKPFFSDVSTYHNSYFIDPRLPNPMVKAPQLNHSDSQILGLVALQDGAKHSTGFLEGY